MEKVGFIKDWETLQEDYRNNPVGFNTQTVKFSRYLDKLPSNKSAVIGFIGGLGTGKSALLEKVKKERNRDNEKWWQFDAWKYQDKSNLWKSFLLEFANDNIGWLQRNYLARKFVGKRYIIWQAVIILGTTFAGIKYADLDSLLNIVFPAAGLFLASLLIDLPLAHLPSIQKEFINYLNKDKNKKVILLEDIDRANDAGVHFLETLSFLLKDESLKNKQIVIIATIGKDEFSNKRSSYEKCLDFMYFSQLPNPNMYKFVEDIFDENIFSTNINYREQVVRFLAELVDLPDGSIRKIKLLLRDAAIIYEKFYQEKNKYDWRMIIAFTAMKYFYVSTVVDQHGNKIVESYAEQIKKQHVVSERNPFFRLFLAIANDVSDLNPADEEFTTGFKFDEIDSSLPKLVNPEMKNQKTQGNIGLHYKEIVMIR